MCQSKTEMPRAHQGDARRLWAGLGLTAALLWLQPPAPLMAEGLWDRIREGAAATVERGGALIQEGAEKGLELGGALAAKGVDAGLRLAEDAAEHFYRDGTPQEVRERVDRMAFDTLDGLFADDPQAHLSFDSGYGYAVFEVRQVSLTVTAGYGYGVAAGGDGGRRRYMKMATGGLEFAKGLGGYEAKWVILFADRAAFDTFVEQGFDASLEVGAQALDQKAELGTRLREGIAFYRVTKGGLKVAALVTGTRFWPDLPLNESIEAATPSP